MRPAEFIEADTKAILAEWEALTCAEARDTRAATVLSNHVPQLLGAIAAALRTRDSETSRDVLLQTLRSLAELHGADGAPGGHGVQHLLDEYRLLRKSVLRAWQEKANTLPAGQALADAADFNEVLDQASSVSIALVDRELDRGRSEREASERAHSLTRTRLEFASRLSRVGFWYCDLPFDVLEWDDQVKEHFFFEPSARITIADFYERIHPEDRERTRVAIEGAIQDKSAYDIVYRTLNPATGEVKWIRALGGTDYASDGTPIHFDGITVDVTAQKLEEKRVAESEARHRGVLANMGEAFTLFDADFTIVEVNEAACKLVGSSRAELIGCNHWERFPGTYDSELGRMYRQVLADGNARSLEHSYTFDDGRTCWLEARSFFVGPGVAVLFRDVTERRNLIEALQATDRRKDEFLAMLAHELRNPLAPITSVGEILSRIPNPPQAVAAATAIIRRQARHLTRLVEDLLDVARVTQGRIQLQMDPVEISSVVAQAIETCQAQLEAKHQQLSVTTVGPASLYVRGDFSRLVQCVCNIVGNASKYTDPDGAIRIAVSATDEEVSIEVSDNGSGIPSDLLPHIFDLFVQSKRTLDRSQGGLGVGLAVVRRLIAEHGGTVTATSKGEGHGSTFFVRLPRIAEPRTALDTSTREVTAPTRILVVDDNVDAAESLLLLLSMQGHEVQAAHTAGEALERIGNFKPAVVLIDIGLPDMDGYALARALNELPHLASLRKIALTGYGQPQDRARALDAGFYDHLVKPVDIDTLHRVIAAFTD
jgi:PAS domain S-box-containing protein